MCHFGAIQPDFRKDYLLQQIDTCCLLIRFDMIIICDPPPLWKKLLGLLRYGETWAGMVELDRGWWGIGVSRSQ